ncbi:hypothetical protein BDQ17DRAFT_1403881 [Cyathus striatus]|nr:hypothetical protein BDQ17DRAFT_1403881 [Cyathus striatus]
MATQSYSTAAQSRLSVRIDHVDYTLIPPGPLDNTSLALVPTIRIFGISSTGENTCAHIHQVYPYLFVEYTGRLEAQHVKRYISKFNSSLNHAIAASFKRDTNPSISRFIRAVLLVKGIHFYGFHSSYSPFLKILVANPGHINRISVILQSGTVMSTRFCVYESHLSYILQFMCDFGLYGCGFINVEDALQRFPNQSDEEFEHGKLTMLTSTPTSFEPSPYFRTSRVPLEVDIIAPQILNRHRLKQRLLHHKLKIPSTPSPPEPLVISVRELWDDERARRKARGLDPSPEIPVDPTKSSRVASTQWVAEARWWEEIQRRLETEKEIPSAPDNPTGWERWTMTVFESIEALWEEQYRCWKPMPSQRGEELNTLATTLCSEDNVWENLSGEQKIDLDVDLSMLSCQELDALDEIGLEDNRDIQNNYVDEEDEDAEGIESKDAEYEDTELQTSKDLTPIVEGIANESPKRRDESSQDPFTDIHDHSTHNLSLQTQFQLQIPPTTPANLRSLVKAQSLSPTKSYAPNDLQSPDGSSGGTSASTEKQTTFNLNADPLGSDGDAASDSDSDSRRFRKKARISTPFCETDGMFSLSSAKTAACERTRTEDLCRAITACKAINLNCYDYVYPPPTVSSLLGSLEEHGIPSKVYTVPHFSRADDVTGRPYECAGLTYKAQGRGVNSLTEWNVEPHVDSSNLSLDYFTSTDRPLKTLKFTGWEYSSHPPAAREVRKWLSASPSLTRQMTLQGLMQNVTYDGTTANARLEDSTLRTKENMSVLSVEVFAPSEGEKVPDPEMDGIAAAFYACHISGTDIFQTGVILIDVVLELDPDIIVGWEIECCSWGYFAARSACYGLDITEFISRAPPCSRYGNGLWGSKHNTSLKITGRHVLNLWRIIRSEKQLTSYTFENAIFQVLGQRVPHYSTNTLTDWYHSTVPMHTFFLVSYFARRAKLNLQMLEEAEIITKTAEFARVFGVDFFSVITRGSQFKVESFMFRIAKPENLILISPSKRDVGKQNAAECMPLIMEPISAFYSSPLLVLDFQSLYPSVIIAYNYCYSTCLGRVNKFQGNYKFGVTNLDLPIGLLDKLTGHISVAPNGMIYVKPEVRRGLLGRMLIEILETRVMIKQAMKGVGVDTRLKKILDARQLGLKYIANVTYGYTGATLSGRMPAVEIADSIVQSGREILEKAVNVINATPKWGAQVVYGDTDSVFVHLRGKTREQAFMIGNEIADRITAINPVPIKLKFEKRYVGFKYENADEREPTFDAKGIETVRRDGVLAQREMVENCLKLLFRTQDLSEVKDYCLRSWTKLLENRASVQDFIFAKEVRMGNYSDNVIPPPGVMVAARKMMDDPNNEPQFGDRIPYVIIKSDYRKRLSERAMDPLEFVNNRELRLDTTYYITQVLIPPLERIFNLVGASVRQWYQEMPRVSSIVEEPSSPQKMSPTKHTSKMNSPKEDTDSPPPSLHEASDELDDTKSSSEADIYEHFDRNRCILCGVDASDVLCNRCRDLPQETISDLGSSVRINERRFRSAHQICVSCSGMVAGETVQCDSIDCPWLYARKRAERDIEAAAFMKDIIEDMEIECYEMESLRNISETTNI